METDLSRRVKDWELRIKPILKAEETHAPFDIHQYGRTVLEEFADGDDEGVRA